jgi:Tol biopolymer transport system component
VRATGAEPCRIVILPIPRGAERTVGRCSRAPATRLAWLDERTLLLSDSTDRGQVTRIRALDIETGAARDFSRPGGDSLGDTDPLPSPDGRQVAFRRVISHGVDEVYLADARTGAERRLTGGWKALGYAWAPDGRTLFLATNRGGDFGLWTLDTRRTAEPKRMSLGLRNGMNFGRLSSDRTGRLAVETSSQRKNLFTSAGAGAATPLTASTGRDWDPDVSPDGGLVFVSDQSGAPEVWVRPDGGEPARVTQLSASYVHTPRWSPDGRRVAFIAARDEQTDLWLMNADGSGLTAVTRDGAAKAQPVWGPDWPHRDVRRAPRPQLAADAGERLRRRGGARSRRRRFPGHPARLGRRRLRSQGRRCADLAALPCWRRRRSGGPRPARHG